MVHDSYTMRNRNTYQGWVSSLGNGAFYTNITLYRLHNFEFSCQNISLAFFMLVFVVGSLYCRPCCSPMFFGGLACTLAAVLSLREVAGRCTLESWDVVHREGLTQRTVDSVCKFATRSVNTMVSCRAKNVRFGFVVVGRQKISYGDTRPI